MAQPRTIALALELSQPWQWHQLIYAGALRYAREQNWRTVIDEFPEAQLSGRRGRSRPYDGVIARVHTPLFKCARQLNLPLVNVWFNSPAKRHAPSVFPDFALCGKWGARHLLERGFRRFGGIIAPKHAHAVAQWNAFAAEVREAGCSVNLISVPDADNFTLASWTDLRRRIEQYLSSLQPPVGLLVKRSFHARQVVHLCGDRGWRVPQEVAIVCSENEPIMCDHPPPSLSSIDANWELVGYRAAKLLDQIMADKPPVSLPILVPPLQVMARASTDFVAVQDEVVAEALAFIARNLHRRLAAPDVAQGILATPRTLSRRFRSHLGRSVAEEVRRLRLELAKRLLRDPNKSIQEIARTAGFSSPNRLCEVFQRELRLTPQAYRDQILTFHGG